MSWLSWTCPEDGTRLQGADRDKAEEAVREHFRTVTHTSELAGFTVSGPAVAGLPLEEVRP